MADTFRCKLITPQEKVLEDDVRQAIVPAWDGLFGVLPGRAPIVSKLGLGPLRLDFPGPQGDSRSFLIEDGFVQMVGNELTILAKSATPAEELNETDAKAALAEANARKVPEGANQAEELERITRDRRRAQLSLQLAEKVTKAGI